jgi:hypothetical protein
MLRLPVNLKSMRSLSTRVALLLGILVVIGVAQFLPDHLRPVSNVVLVLVVAALVLGLLVTDYLQERRNRPRRLTADERKELYKAVANRMLGLRGGKQ